MTNGLPDPRIPAGLLSGAWQRTREGLPLISPLPVSYTHLTLPTMS